MLAVRRGSLSTKRRSGRPSLPSVRSFSVSFCASYAPVHYEKVPQIDALQCLMCMHAALALNVAFQRAPPSIEVSNIVIVLTLGFAVLHQTKEAVILTKSGVQSSYSRRRYSWVLCSSLIPSMTCRQ